MRRLLRSSIRWRTSTDERKTLAPSETGLLLILGMYPKICSSRMGDVSAEHWIMEEQRGIKTASKAPIGHFRPKSRLLPDVIFSIDGVFAVVAALDICSSSPSGSGMACH